MGMAKRSRIELVPKMAKAARAGKVAVGRAVIGRIPMCAMRGRSVGRVIATMAYLNGRSWSRNFEIQRLAIFKILCQSEMLSVGRLSRAM
jgi:hypothetical protein